MHLGVRQDLGDSELRIAGGADVTQGHVGVEVQLAARLGDGWSDQYVATFSLQNDGVWSVTREDIATAALLVTFAPLADASVGPTLGVGPELGVLRHDFDDGGDDPHRRVVDETPFVAAGLVTRAGVHARVGRVGLRFTLAYRLDFLGEPDFDNGLEEPKLVGEWRSGMDVLVWLP